MAPNHRSRKRVLLVEDDASIRDFVALVLEDQPVELVSAPSLSAARAALAEDVPPALVLLDMMLPDGSGTQLLQDAAARRAAGDAHWVVFSAALTPALRQELPALGVRRILTKPVTLAALIDCVQAALRLPQVGTPPQDGFAAHAPADRRASADGSPQAEAHAITAYFENDVQLFRVMKARTIAQLSQDLRAAEAAMATADAVALRRIAHTLKTVLRMIGHPAAADLAYSLEQAAETGDRMLWPSLWQALRQLLIRLGADRTPG